MSDPFGKTHSKPDLEASGIVLRFERDQIEDAKFRVQRRCFAETASVNGNVIAGLQFRKNELCLFGRNVCDQLQQSSTDSL